MALKWLVIVLIATSIAGIVAIVALFWTRLPRPAPPLPAGIALPDGTRVEAFTRGRGFLAVVTDAGEILILDPGGRRVTQRIVIETDGE